MPDLCHQVSAGWPIYRCCTDRVCQHSSRTPPHLSQNARFFPLAYVCLQWHWRELVERIEPGKFGLGNVYIEEREGETGAATPPPEGSNEIASIDVRASELTLARGESRRDTSHTTIKLLRTAEEASVNRRAENYHTENKIDTPSTRSGNDERKVENSDHPSPPSVMAPLNPPNPAFAKDRRPKDSAYYSARPGEPLRSSEIETPSEQSSESHATWSELSLNTSQGDGVEPAAEKKVREKRQDRRR